MLHTRRMLAGKLTDENAVFADGKLEVCGRAHAHVRAHIAATDTETHVDDNGHTSFNVVSNAKRRHAYGRCQY
jgi:hypothetical protein